MENNRTEMHEEEQQLQSTLAIAKEQLDQAQKALREKGRILSKPKDRCGKIPRTE